MPTLRTTTLLATAFLTQAAIAQQCTTQSQMQAADRDALVRAAAAFATDLQSNNAAAIQARTMPQYAKDFSGFAATIAATSPHLAHATFQTSTLWILDASRNQSGSDGSPQDTQFFCNLNKTTAETSFLIHSLPQGRYALAVLDTAHAAAPWQIAMLLQQAPDKTWQLAGLFPRATTAAGHDGLWYWRQARTTAAQGQHWTAWVDYREAEQLLKPVTFLTSTHLDQLREEQAKAAPPALSTGISAQTPLALKARDGTDFALTSLGPDSSLTSDRIDVAVHFRAEAIPDPAAARLRNQKAASALVTAYPELRDHFHGVWVFADSPNTPPFASEEPMSTLP